MGGKFEMGRIAGLPIVIDASFILLAVVFGSRYFTSGNTTMMSVGFVIVLGLALSILLHELAHAAVGHYFGVRPSHVELNGLGGLCYWATSMRPEAWPRVAISVAGPAANLALWFLLDTLRDFQSIDSHRLLANVIGTLAFYNWWLFVFNMMPAFPLDGGKALDALLGKVLSATNAARVVAVLGLALAAYCAYYAIDGILNQTGGIWLILIAALLGMTNWQALQRANTPPWQRWN